MSAPASTPRATPASPATSGPAQPDAIRVIATLPRHGNGITSLVRRDPARGRVVVRWFEGPFGGRMGAEFVELATGHVTAWDVDPEVADTIRLGEPDPAIVARWHREVLGEAPGPIFGLEYPNRESQLVQRDAAGAHPVVRDTHSFDSGAVTPGSGGRIAWATYVPRFSSHALAIAGIDPPTARPTYLRDAPSPRYLAWSADGATLYAKTSEKLGDGVVATGALLPATRDCFVKIDAATAEVTPVRCSVAPEEMSIAYDARRTRAAIITRRRDELANDIELVALPSGESLGAVANVDLLNDVVGVGGALDASGRLIAPAVSEGIAIVDIVGKKQWHLADRRFYLDVATAGELDGERWLAVGANMTAGWDAQVPELVMIDLAAATTRAPRRLASVQAGVPDPELPVRTAADRFWERATPCAAGQRLVSRAAIAGTEHACVDRRGARAGAYAIIDGDVWSVRGAYRRGERDGTWTYYSHGAPIVEMHLVAGQQEGRLRGWYADGQRMYDATLRGGRADGAVAYWHPGGHLARAGTFANGDQVGTWCQWSARGVLVSEATYADNKLVGTSRTYRDTGVRRDEVDWGPNQTRLWERTYDEAGRLQRALGYRGDENVADRVYWPDGRLRMRGDYRNHRADGEEEYWSEDGRHVEMCLRHGQRTRGRCGDQPSPDSRP